MVEKLATTLARMPKKRDGLRSEWFHFVMHMNKKMNDVMLLSQYATLWNTAVYFSCSNICHLSTVRYRAIVGVLLCLLASGTEFYLHFKLWSEIYVLSFWGFCMFLCIK